MGRHFPAMAVVEVIALIEAEAQGRDRGHGGLAGALGALLTRSGVDIGPSGVLSARARPGLSLTGVHRPRRVRVRGQRAAARLRERAERLEQRLKDKRDQLRARVEEFIGRIKQAIPEATRTSPRVQSRGRTGEQTIDTFLTGILKDVDGYWTKTLRASDLPEPRVSYVWVPPGVSSQSACGRAGDDAAFYCPGDDTIYVSQQFAGRPLPRRRPRPSRPERGLRPGRRRLRRRLRPRPRVRAQPPARVRASSRGPSATAEPFELQADCLAGSWGNSVYAAGHLKRRATSRRRSTPRWPSATSTSRRPAPRHPRPAPRGVAARLRERQPARRVTATSRPA